MRIFITGMAGFIGFHTAKRLSELGHEVVGYDSVNDYYDPGLKEARLSLLKEISSVRFIRGDLEDLPSLERAVSEFSPQVIVHLAAQAGVRYSLENPLAYISSNITGFAHVLEIARKVSVEHLVYASSSSVYGGNAQVPFSVSDRVDEPLSLYAATKKSNELMAYVYSHLYSLRTTGLRFFTVYGPWGRPDMAYYKFSQSILAGKPIQVYNFGDMRRDFTYIDDVVSGILGVLESKTVAGNSLAKVYNIGNNKPENLMDFVRCLEELLGKKAKLELLPLQPGDVLETAAEIQDSTKDFGFKPTTNLRQGLTQFVEWYKSFHGAG